MHEVPIITYHSIDDSGSCISTSPVEFERQLAYLQDSGYRSLALRDGIRRIRNGEDLPERAVIITFDDGYRSNLTHALPLLKCYGYTATIFLATQYLGSENEWEKPGASIPRLPMMTWDEIRTLRDSGIDFGSHTQSHPRLSGLSIERVRNEMLQSKHEIERALDETVGLFAYPYGDYNEAVKEVATEIFDAAVANRPGRLHKASELFALDRINAGSRIFRALPLRLAGYSSFGFYLTLKNGLDSVRR